MQTISAMNSQSNFLEWVQIDWYFGLEKLKVQPGNCWSSAEKCCRNRPRKVTKIGRKCYKNRQKCYQNSNLFVLKMRCFNPIGMPPTIGTTLCAVKSIGSFNLFGRPPSVNQNLFTRASKTNDFSRERAKQTIFNKKFELRSKNFMRANERSGAHRDTSIQIKGEISSLELCGSTTAINQEAYSNLETTKS